MNFFGQPKTSGKVLGFGVGMVTPHPVQSALNSVHKNILH